jgi:hypothetical protein
MGAGVWHANDSLSSVKSWSHVRDIQHAGGPLGDAGFLKKLERKSRCLLQRQQPGRKRDVNEELSIVGCPRNSRRCQEQR